MSLILKYITGCYMYSNCLAQKEYTITLKGVSDINHITLA